MSKKKSVHVKAHNRSLPSRKNGKGSPNWSVFFALVVAGGAVYFYNKL